MRFNRNMYIQLTPLIMITDVTALNLVEVLMDLFVQICSSTRVVRKHLQFLSDTLRKYSIFQDENMTFRSKPKFQNINIKIIGTVGNSKTRDFNPKRFELPPSSLYLQRKPQLERRLTWKNRYVGSILEASAALN